MRWNAHGWHFEEKAIMPNAIKCFLHINESGGYVSTVEIITDKGC